MGTVMVDVVLDIIEQGGPVFIAIILAGIWVWFLLIDRSYVLRKNKAPLYAEEKEIISEVISGSPEKLQSKLSRYRGIYSGLMLMLQENRLLGNSTLKRKTDEYIIKNWSRMEEGFSTIRVLTAAIPLLGLLGTVTGMVRTFRVITMFGSGNPVLLAGGISEALLTTQSGLVLAFPAIIFLVTVSNRKVRLKSVMEHSASQVLNNLREKENG
ncbi:MAG: MotA/TolQ/ExbB proton channel family protein [Fibrobacterota bacterium]